MVVPSGLSSFLTEYDVRTPEQLAFILDRKQETLLETPRKTRKEAHLWVWRNFRLQVPAEWEMLQFSRETSSGRCAFADRYQFRLEFSWRAVAAAPDFDRMISDYKSKLEEEGMKGVKVLHHGSWHGLKARLDHGRTSRFGRFFSRESCLVELVFLWPDKIDEGLQTEIVDSVAEEPERDGRLQRWRAFGMDMLVPNDLEFTDCVVECARAEMVFADKKGKVTERFMRLGMVSEWLSGTVDNWLRERLRRDVKAANVSVGSDSSGHQVYRLYGEKKVHGLRDRLRRCDASAWICPVDARLYGTFRLAPAKDFETIPGPTAKRLSCCREVGMAK